MQLCWYFEADTSCVMQFLDFTREADMKPLFFTLLHNAARLDTSYEIFIANCFAQLPLKGKSTPSGARKKYEE